MTYDDTISDDSSEPKDFKRVARAELYAEDNTSFPAPPRAAAGKEYYARLAEVYGQVATGSAAVQEQSPDLEVEPAFRLFSSGPAQAIELENEDEAIGTGNGGFVVYQRPHARSYYFATGAEGPAREKFDVTAMSGEDVLRRRMGRAWGLEVPWRVSIIRVECGRRKELAIGTTQSLEPNSTRAGRKKPGKKRRIMLRERARMKASLQDALEMQTQEIEREEQEKSTKRNREKKAKRRIKAKAKKVTGNAAFTNQPAVSADSLADAG